MNTTTIAVASARRTALTTRMRDVIELTKPRIVSLVLFTVGAAALVASWGQPDPTLVLHAALGTILIAASGSICNQWYERDTDAKMKRTADRPLVAGRMSNREALTWSAVCGAGGILYLWWTTNGWTAWWGGLCWCIYVLAYTPLKRRSSWNTAVGAVAGALPMWIGWSAVAGQADVRAAAMFLLVFLWQFPHFMAIAWLYRHQYARAGIQVATVVDPSGRAAGVQAVLGAISLLPVTMVLALSYPESKMMLAVACLMGVAQACFAWQFFRRRDDGSARALLRSSLVYLPVVLALLGASPWT